jgi:hypothetical protein
VRTPPDGLQGPLFLSVASVFRVPSAPRRSCDGFAVVSLARTSMSGPGVDVAVGPDDAGAGPPLAGGWSSTTAEDGVEVATAVGTGVGAEVGCSGKVGTPGGVAVAVGTGVEVLVGVATLSTRMGVGVGLGAPVIESELTGVASTGAGAGVATMGLSGLIAAGLGIGTATTGSSSAAGTALTIAVSSTAPMLAASAGACVSGQHAGVSEESVGVAGAGVESGEMAPAAGSRVASGLRLSLASCQTPNTTADAAQSETTAPAATLRMNAETMTGNPSR